MLLLPFIFLNINLRINTFTLADLLIPKFAHHQFDKRFPGICFLNDLQQVSVTSEGQSISWEDIGINFSIPPGAVPEGKSLGLTVRPCLCGPYVLPEGYELASPVFMISPAFNFKKDIKLSIRHYVDFDGEDEEDDDVVFISARSTPVYTSSQPMYKFRILRKDTVFERGKQEGSVFLQHFCDLAIARRRSKCMISIYHISRKSINLGQEYSVFPCLSD